MDFENVKKMCDWLEKNFNDNFMYNITKDITTNIIVSIYNEDYGWQDKALHFDKQGKNIPNYEKQIEIKRQIKELQKELEKLQENS